MSIRCKAKTEKSEKELKMSNDATYKVTALTPKTSVLKEIFDIYEEETITEDQVKRVLEPVLKMIREGRFDRPRRRQYGWLVSPLSSMITVGTLIIIVWLAG